MKNFAFKCAGCLGFFFGLPKLRLTEIYFGKIGEYRYTDDRRYYYCSKICKSAHMEELHLKVWRRWHPRSNKSQ